MDVADGKHARNHVGRESPISNGLTTVAGVEIGKRTGGMHGKEDLRGAKTRFLI